MTDQGLFVKEALNQRKAARTRARLMDAAVDLFARDGFEAASVNAIAKAADVANGTFYVHFRDKDEIAAAVAFGIAGEVVAQLDAAMTDITDALLRISIATRHFIDLACTQISWGRALFRAVWVFPDLHDGVITYLRGDLQRGVDQAAFSVTIDDALIDTFAAMTLGALFSRLQGNIGPEVGSRVSELQLLMLGVDKDLAHQVAWQPLTPLTLKIPTLPRIVVAD